MQIKSTFHEIKIVMAVNAIAACIVIPTILYLYTPELWQYELLLSLSLTFFIATPVSFFMARQVRNNQELNKELQRLVNWDRLTDVATRDYFFDRMEQNPDSFGVSLMVDIDYFKSVNDQHGHLAGDKVIRKVAHLLKENERDDDIVARFGGEEFIVFLKSRNQDSGLKIAERMRNKIEKQIIKFDRSDLRVTVSIGGSLKAALVDVEASIKEADAALYEAKRAGRNCTVFAEGALNLKPDLSLPAQEVLA